MVHEVLRSPGQPLDCATRAFFETRFAHDFSQVRVHTDSKATDSARAVNALAYTVGASVVFGSGHYAPGTGAGKRLLAHELAHVMQQAGRGGIQARLEVGPVNDPLEREADDTANRILQAAPAQALAADKSHDFSGVRVHTAARAAVSAQQVNARAYTVGQNLVFGEGQYAPGITDGQRLLAHELTHVIQQTGGSSLLQRKVVIDGPLDPADPAAGIPQATRVTMAETLVQNLCDDFQVNPTALGDEVEETTAGFCDTPAAVTAGAKPTGCCCLCIMVKSPNTWTIRVTQNEGASTLFPNVVIPPSTSVVESMHWTGGGAAPAHIVLRPRQITLGHELCGHAALSEIGAHPSRAGRTVSDEHDPTVKIERLIWGEQSLPSAEERGLAASGVHRGESVSRVTVAQFSFNSSSVAALPAAEKDKIKTAKDFIVTNDWFVDVLGHSDPVGSGAAKLTVSQKRAEAVRDELLRLGVSSDISSVHLPGSTVPRFSRVEGLSDTQPLSSGTPHAQWRRADILMANFPAGAQVPPAGTPVAVGHAPPQFPIQATLGLISPDACIRHMTQGAWL